MDVRGSDTTPVYSCGGTIGVLLYGMVNARFYQVRRAACKSEFGVWRL